MSEAIHTRQPSPGRVVLLCLTTALLGLFIGRWSPQLVSAAGVAPVSSHPGCAHSAQFRLFFGMVTPHGRVSDKEWTEFLAQVVTPRFPDGLTVVRADGQWRGAGTDSVTREPSQVVEILADDTTGVERRIQEIVASYRLRFQQESVLITRDNVEACF